MSNKKSLENANGRVVTSRTSDRCMEAASFRYREAPVEGAELLVLSISEPERITAVKVVEQRARQFHSECGKRGGHFSYLLGGFILDMVKGLDDKSLWVVCWDSFVGECEIAIRDDACRDQASGRAFSAVYCFEDALSSIVSELLERHSFRAAHNALNILVAFHRLLTYTLKEMTGNLPSKPQEGEFRVPF